jgi:hypothetical protein
MGFLYRYTDIKKNNVLRVGLLYICFLTNWKHCKAKNITLLRTIIAELTDEMICDEYFVTVEKIKITETEK